jgi:outer membrane protein assembly factor BamB
MTCDVTGHVLGNLLSRRMSGWRGRAFGLLVPLVFALGCSRRDDAGVAVAREAITAPSFIQGNYADPQASQSSVAVTFSAAQTAGDLVVVVVGWFDTNAQVTSVTDSANDVYQLAVGPTKKGTQVSQSIYYAAPVASWAAGNKVTVKFNRAAKLPDVRILAYRNVSPTHPFDVAVASSGSGAAATSGAVTTTNANDLLVGADTVNSSTLGPGSGFTSRMITSPDGDVAEDRTVTAIGSYSATAPLQSAGSVAWVMQMVAFRANDTQVPTAPSNLTATATSASRIDLVWSPSTDDVGVTGYLVERCQGAGCSNFAQIGTSASPSFSDTAVAGQTSYSYRVRATDAANNLSAYSGVATAVTIGALAAPCTAGGQCGSGFCVAGICCDSACTGNACMACDVPGLAGHCSARPDGTSCSDGNACTLTDACLAGTCTGANPVVCAAQDQCHLSGTCDPTSGACTNPTAPDGTSCSDGNACTLTDACVAGACLGANPVICAALDVCHVAGVCDPASGACTNPAAADGTSCSDGNACTRSDSCQGGTCVGANPVTCNALDQCHAAGTCDPASGACSNPAAADGAPCSDGNGCTQADTCRGGACTSGAPVTCTAQDQCHLAGTCDPATGACSNPGKVGGSTLCGTVCVDAADDDLNCGGCNVVCPDGQGCAAGVCRAGLSRWPTLGGDVRHSGYNANETGGPPIALAWNQSLGSNALQPAVADGTSAYVTDRSHLWAVSPSDGHRVWSHDFGSVFSIGQATAGSGRVYVGQSNNAGSTFMYSFDSPTGTMLWSRPFNSQWERYWAPLVVGTNIYFDGGTYGGLYGLSTLNGGQLFFNNQLEQYDSWSPLSLGGRIYTFIAGKLRAHDPMTGSVLGTSSVTWNWAGYSMQSAPISDGGSIYVIAPPSLYAFTPGAASPSWAASASYAGMPAIASGVLYAVSGGQLRATDAARGDVLWTFAADSVLDHPPVVAGRWVYTASDAHVYAVDTATQQVAWTGAPGGWLSVAGGKLYVAQPNGTLAAYALARGTAIDVCSGAPDGTSCSDGNACTQVDSCQAGVCVGSIPVTCAALDRCHLPGACDPGTGSCSNPARPGGGTDCGSACVDTTSDPANCGGCNIACATGETCSAGTCQLLSAWPTLGGDVQHTGFNANETGTPPLGLSWSEPLSPGALWPAVSDGTSLYISEKGPHQNTTNIWAISPDDGHVIWSHDFGRVFGGIGQPTVDSGRVYVAQVNNTLGTFIYAFAAATGQALWSQPFNDQWDNVWAPLVLGPQIYFDGGSYGGLYGLAAASGAQLFFDNQLEQYDEWSPLSLGGKVYTFVAGKLRAHDALAGSVLATTSVPWTFSSYSMKTAPVSDGTKVYAIAPPSLYAIDPGTMTVAWSATAAYSGMAAVAGGVVYAVSGGKLVANDAITGATLWTFPADSALAYPPVVAGQWVYAASSANVYAVDVTTGQAAWSGAPGGWLSIARGGLYVAQANGTLSAYALGH